MKSEQDRIAALEQALAEAHLTLRVYDELIVQANRHYKTDLKKVFWEFRDDDVTSGAPLGIVNGTEVSHDRAGIRCTAQAAGRVGRV